MENLIINKRTKKITQILNKGPQRRGNFFMPKGANIALNKIIYGSQVINFNIDNKDDE